MSIISNSTNNGVVVYLEKRNYLKFADNIDHSVYYEYDNSKKLNGLMQMLSFDHFDEKSDTLFEEWSFNTIDSWNKWLFSEKRTNIFTSEKFALFNDSIEDVNIKVKPELIR